MRTVMPRKPKQRLNLLKLAAQKLDAKLETSDGRRLSKREIGVIKLVNRFVETGDPKIFTTLVEIVHQGGRPEITYRAPSADVTEWTDNEVFEAFNAFWDRDIPAAWEN
jgi:hypothetical protein